MNTEQTEVTHCNCGTAIEGLPIDVAYYNAGLKGYAVQHTCPACKRTLSRALTGTTKEILIQVLSSNNLMTKGGDESRRRLLASEAILHLFRDQEKELHTLYNLRNRA